MKTTFFLALMIVFFGAAQGQHHVPAPMKDHDVASVVVFLSPWCPISQKYIPSLNALYDEYAAKDVEWFALMPGKVTTKERKKFVNDFHVKFPVLSDKKYKWALSMGASVTPEIFLFDQKDALQYHGAIDNWFYDLGLYRSEPTEHYLINALQDVLAGNAPKLKSTEATGCSIQLPQ